MDPVLRDRWLARASARLADEGLRAGAARTTVVEVLARDAQCLRTAQEVIDLVRARGAGSAASVYRALDELSSLGLLDRVDGRDGAARYEISDPERHHHHVIDEGSGDVVAFADEPLEEAIEAVASRLGLRLTGHEVVLRGTFED